MFIKIGKQQINPESVCAVYVQEEMSTGIEVVLISLHMQSFPIVHRDFQGSAETEAIRIADLVTLGTKESHTERVQLFNETASLLEDGEEMIRMPVEEHESQMQAAYQAGVDSCNPGNSVVILSGESLRELSDAVMTPILQQVYADQESIDRFRDQHQDLLRKVLESNFNGIGIQVQWLL